MSFNYYEKNIPVKHITPHPRGVNFIVLDILRQDARIQGLYFIISEMKLSITSLYIISDTPKYDIIWTENSDVNSLISNFRFQSK